MRKLLVALLAAGSLVAMTVAPAAAITKNWQNDSQHPFVGLIAFYNPETVDGVFNEWTFNGRCTGELIAPQVVLTAGHCTDNGAQGVNKHARIWFEQNGGRDYDSQNDVADPNTGYPYFCKDPNFCYESGEMYNYGFDNFAGYPNIHDVGIVILDRPVENIAPGTLANAGVLDALLKARGTQETTFTVSGYGISYTAHKDTVVVSYRVRLMATEKLVNLVSKSTDGYVIQLNGNGDDRGGTCSGDSGGPVFYQGQIVAVTSWGHSNAGCRGDGWYYRMDQQAVLDWIQLVAGDYL